MGPLGLLIPHPGVSYLFADGPQSAFSGTLSPSLSQHSYPNSNPPDELRASGSLWSIANGGLPATGGFSFGAGPLPAWSSSLGELVLKIDNKFKVRLLITMYTVY